MDFNQIASTWDNDSLEKRAQAISMEIESYFGHGPLEVMEFGCKTGLISFNLKLKKATDYLLVENCSEMIKEVERKINDRHITNMQTYQGDILQSNLEQKFDIIYSALTLHHIKDFQPVIEKLTSYLKENGKLVIVDLLPDNGQYHSQSETFDGHNGFKITEMVDSLKQAGLKEVVGRKFYSSYRPLENRKHPYGLFSVIGVK